MLDEDDRRNTRILAVSMSTHEEMDLAVERVHEEYGLEIDYTLLSDPDSRVIDRYGVRNPDGEGWPHPSTYIVDREGVVRWRFVETDYRVRAENEDILAALEGLGDG